MMPFCQISIAAFLDGNRQNLTSSDTIMKQLQNCGHSVLCESQNWKIQINDNFLAVRLLMIIFVCVQ